MEDTMAERYTVTIEKTDETSGGARVSQVVVMGVVVGYLCREYIRGGCAGRGGNRWFFYLEGGLENELPVGPAGLWFRSTAETLFDLSVRVRQGLESPPIFDERYGLLAGLVVGWIARQRYAANLASEEDAA